MGSGRTLAPVGSPAVPSSPMVVIRLLGGVSIERDGHALTGPFTHRHRLALLAMLAAAHPRAQSRERLAAHLWPDRPGDSTRNLLNQAVHALRNGLGETTIVSTRNELHLDPGSVRCDVIDFRSALEDADLERAVSLYSGPFLEGFDLPGAAEFEHWVDRERERLRRRCCEALEALAVAATTSPADAVRWWRRLAALEPYSSRVAIGLMQALDAAGNRAAALAHARVHATLLQEEFDAEPNPDVAALAERLRTAPTARLETSEEPNGPGARGGLAAPDGTSEPTAPAPERGDPTPSAPNYGADRAGRLDRLPLHQVGLASLVILAGLLLWLALSNAPGPPLDPGRVLVIPFENRTGDTTRAELGFMAADWITKDLERTGVVKVVPTETALRAARYVKEGLDPGGGDDPVRRVAHETGAGTVITGAYYAVGDSLRFQARITDARRSEVVQSVQPAAALSSHPMPAIDELRRRAVGALASLLDPRLGPAARMASPPPSLEAYRAYREGVEHFIAGRLEEASQAYQRAAAVDSTYMAPRISLAFARFNMGRRAEARSLLADLVGHMDAMGAYDRALVNLLRSWTRPDRVARYEAARRVAQLAPESLPHLQWASEALWLNRPREALSVLADIDPTRGVIRGGPVYWFVLTEAHHILGDHRRELRAVRRARELYPDEARLIWPEVRALAALGRLEELERTVDSRPLTLDLRHPAPNGGYLLVLLGADLAAHGHRAAAVEYYTRALAWYRDRVADGDTEQRGNLAVVLALMDQNQAAEARFRQLALEQPDVMAYRGMLGLLAARQGDRAEAERLVRWLAERGGSPPSNWRAPWYRALIAAQLGDREEAMTRFREAFELGAIHGFNVHVEPFLDPMRGYPPFEELLRPKG